MSSSRKRSRLQNLLDDVRMVLWLARGAIRMGAGRAPWQSRSRR